MKNILIIGYKGFIGSHLYDHWKTDYNITGIDKGHKLPDRDFDLVIHLAGLSGVRESWKNPIAYFKNNILLSLKIFRKYKRVIYASSSTVAEPWRNPYAFSKYIVEKIAPSNSLGIRFTTVYGPNSRKNMLISRIIDNNIKYVNVDCRRDFIHVYDVLEFFKIIMTYKLNGIVNVGTGSSLSIVNLVDPKTPKKLSSFYEMKDNQANIEKIKSLGFKPMFTVEDYINSAR